MWIDIPFGPKNQEKCFLKNQFCKNFLIMSYPSDHLFIFPIPNECDVFVVYSQGKKRTPNSHLYSQPCLKQKANQPRSITVKKMASPQFRAMTSWSSRTVLMTSCLSQVTMSRQSPSQVKPKLKVRIRLRNGVWDELVLNFVWGCYFHLRVSNKILEWILVNH